jgi:2-keto-4-pentenoate hydratase
MPPDPVALAAERLAAARLAGTPVDLDPTLRPADALAAYALQDRVAERLSPHLGPPTAIKIGCTTAVMRAMLGIDSPAAGLVFRDTIAEGSTRLDARAHRRLGVECEIAVEIGRAVPPGSATDPAGVVTAVRAAAEIVDDRYADYRDLGPPTLIADNFFNVGAVIGPAVTGLDPDALDTVVGRLSSGAAEIAAGTGASVMGHPLAALDWLLRVYADAGRTIAAGTVVLLGSVVETRWVVPGERLRLDLEGLGSLAVEIEP